MNQQIGGVQIVVLPLVKEHRAIRTHRKARINKKWLKRYGTKPIPYEDDTSYLVNGNTLYCTAKVAEMLKTKFPLGGNSNDPRAT